MFTGIIAAVASVREVHPSAGGVRIAIDAGALPLADVKIGDSIAVNGACLTVVSMNGQQLQFDVSRETLACTAGYAQGAAVNWAAANPGAAMQVMQAAAPAAATQGGHV